MPHVAISMIPGRSQEVKKELSMKVQDFICKELSLDKDIVSVSAQDIPMEKWEEHMKQFSLETILTR